MRFDNRCLDRRNFLRLAGLSGAAAFTSRSGWALPETADYDPSACKLMEFDVSYKTRFMNFPSDAEDVRLWVPLPSDDAAQQISSFEVESPVPYRIETEPIYGQKMLYVETRELQPFDVEVHYHVTRRQAGAQKMKLDEAEAEKFLQLTQRVRVTDDVESFASEVIGDATDAEEIARRTFDGIREILFYDKTIPGCGTGDTAWIMRHRRGKCDDYHALFMAVLVSRGVPVRWEQGFPLPFPEGGKLVGGELEGDCTGSHCWASFYAEGKGFIPIDVSEADKAPRNGEFFFGRLSPNRFQVSVGRAVDLMPKQGGDPLSTFAFAYAESDGIPLIYDANYVNIIKYDVTRIEMV